jgi:ribosomal-protein-alanine N-acetyltransferase
MNQEISIRPAVVEDAATVLEIERNCAEAPHWSEPIWAQILAQPSDYVAYGATPYGPRRMCLVAEQAEEITGFIVIAMVGVAEIESLAVHAEARRCGVGRSLCLQAALWAQTMGAQRMQLEVRSASVAALSLYRSLGFAEQGRRSGYYTDPKDDAVMMEMQMSTKDA